jgi:hypothetical protein
LVHGVDRLSRSLEIDMALVDMTIKSVPKGPIHHAMHEDEKRNAGLKRKIRIGLEFDAKQAAISPLMFHMS